MYSGGSEVTDKFKGDSHASGKTKRVWSEKQAEYSAADFDSLKKQETHAPVSTHTEDTLLKIR